MGKIYFSQNFDVLANCLADELALQNSCLLQKRWILVPSASFKHWLSVRLAALGEGKILAGCKICSVEEALFPQGVLFPSSLEMMCLIFNALKEEFSSGDKRQWELAAHLAVLFFSYGQHGKDLFRKTKGDWQSRILQKLFTEGSFRLPVQSLLSERKTIQDPVHCFGFDFLPEIFWESLASFPRLSVYLFSPCIHFWEDLCTKWERRGLSRFWKKKGVSFESRKELENYLNEAPPLLSNWGKLGRETLKILDRFPFEAEEAYGELPEKNSLLLSLQREILLFEKSDHPPADDSIHIFLTGSSKMNEVEVLRDEILRIASSCNLPFSEMAVLAPDIHPYVPLIEYLFSDPATPVPYRYSQIE